jgi:hypothetical protein
MRDRRGSPANSNRGNGRVDRDRPLVAELSADKTKHALGERSHHLAGAGSRIIDKIIDHKDAVWTDAKGGFVKEQKLNRPAGRRLNSLIVHDPRADL